jgi:hypothetical protein
VFQQLQHDGALEAKHGMRGKTSIWINTGNLTPLEEKEARNKVLKLKSNARITDRVLRRSYTTWSDRRYGSR